MHSRKADACDKEEESKGKGRDHMKTKRITAVLLVFFTAVCTCLFAAFPGSLSVSALELPETDENASVLLYHNESGTVLYKSEKTDFMQAGPAVRLMAALVFDEFYKDSSRTVKVNRRVTGLATSTMGPGLKSGESISVYDLLCGMLIANSNDTVYALAYDMFDNVENAPELLLEKMNTKARALGMTSTEFWDLTGEDPENEAMSSYTSLDDLLILTLEVEKSKRLTQICSMAEYKVPATDRAGERTLLTRNYMLSAKRVGGFVYSKATGLAAQDSELAGYCVLATADFGGKSFTCLVMGARNERFGAFKEAAKFFDFANKNFSYKTVLKTTQILGEIEVELSGDSDYITVAPERNISAFLPNDIVEEEEIGVHAELSFSRLTAPVHEGLIAGKVRVFYRGEEIGAADLVTTSSLAQINSSYYLLVLQKFIFSPVFFLICGGVILLLVVCVLINARVRYLRQKRPYALSFEDDEDEVEEESFRELLKEERRFQREDTAGTAQRKTSASLKNKGQKAIISDKKLKNTEKNPKKDSFPAEKQPEKEHFFGGEKMSAEKTEKSSEEEREQTGVAFFDLYADRSLFSDGVDPFSEAPGSSGEIGLSETGEKISGESGELEDYTPEGWGESPTNTEE